MVDFKIFFILLVSWRFLFCQAKVACLDPNGNNIDWFSVYKAPMIHGSLDPKLKEGLGQFYLDVHKPEWVLSSQPINASQQQVYNTLQQIYKPEDKDDLMYIMYNDEHPDDLFHRSSGGHTKGVVAFDKTSGFWLVHSVPRFPPKQSKSYDWPHTEFGQTFLCVTLPYKSLTDVVSQLQVNDAHIYDSNTPQHYVEDVPLLKEAILMKYPSGPPKSIKTLTSLGGQEFLSFAKSNKFGADLYDDLVAPTLKQNLLVETWLRHSGTPLNSNCSAKYKVLKVTEVKLPYGVDFDETKDHAKWAVTSQENSHIFFESQNVFQMNVENEKNWACVGDINRMKSQFKRGGGTLCIQHSGVWKAYLETVAHTETCP